jgi:hypothetical protein
VKVYVVAKVLSVVRVLVASNIESVTSMSEPKYLAKYGPIAYLKPPAFEFALIADDCQ